MSHLPFFYKNSCIFNKLFHNYFSICKQGMPQTQSNGLIITFFGPYGGQMMAAKKRKRSVNDGTQPEN
jgi:hypothetical protein